MTRIMEIQKDSTKHKNEVIMENKIQLWDFVKCRIRSETIVNSIKSKRK